MALSHDADHALDSVVREDALAHYLKRRWVSMAGNQFGAGLLTIPGWILAGQVAAVSFLLSFTLVNLATLGVKSRVLHMPRELASYGKRSRLVAASSGLLGASLAAGNIVLHQLAGPDMLIYSVAVQAGIGAASLGVSSFHLPSMRSYLLFGLGLYLLSLGFVPSSLQVQVLGLGTTIALCFLLVMGAQQAGILSSAIRLQHQNDALVHKLALENAAATEARNTAQRANQEKSHFFASASHDLRQPVHALNLYASLLKDPVSDAERKDVLERIETCVQTLDDLFESLLTVTRAESLDPAEIELAPIALGAVIRTVIHQVLPQADAQGTQLVHCPTTVWVQSDRLALERILSNLIANAVAFSPNGRVLVGVRRRGARVEVQVLDNGAGIAEDQKQQIFGEFYQAANPGRRSGQGFGLGLVIVERLCSALGYPLSVHSTFGKGSCFGVSLPRCSAAPDELEVRPHPGGHISTKLQVLLVDDEESVRDAMARLFAKWDVSATICASTHEAIKVVREKPDTVNCILVDQRLGEGLDGVSLAQQLNALLPRAMPVAIITGETAGDWYEQAQMLGFSVLFKPVKQIRLRAFLVAASKRG